MTKEQARKKLFEELDKLFIKYGADAGLCDPGFFPHYSEVGVNGMRPTWYLPFHIDNDTFLYTFYEPVCDYCISTLFVRDKKPKALFHTGYPKNLEEAKEMVKKFE